MVSMQLQDKGYNSESYIFIFAPFQINILSRMMTPDRRALVTHMVLLLNYVPLYYFFGKSIT